MTNIFHVVSGADKVAWFIFGLARCYGSAFFTVNQLALFNGDLGAYIEGRPGVDSYPRDDPADHRDDGTQWGSLCSMVY